MIRERIYQTLANDAGLSALVTVIRPIVLNQSDALPAITYQIEKQHDFTFEGNSGLVRVTLELNVFADDLATAEEINSALQTALDALPGVENGESIYNVYLERELEAHDLEQGEYRINTQFIVNYSEG